MSDFLGAGPPRRKLPSRAEKGSPGPSGPDRQRISSPSPSLTSRRALDWFVFFLADVQTGFGAFVSVYLTTEKWTQTDIGLVLTVGAVVGLVGQIPGGAIVDAARSLRWVAAAAVAAVGLSAFALAMSPIFVVVFSSRILQAGASCVLGPAIAAISLGLVGSKGISARLGRNASFRFSRLRPRRGGHGRLRILHFEPRGLYPRGEYDGAGAIRPLPNTSPRN